jgi:hypothetical protein
VTVAEKGFHGFAKVNKPHSRLASDIGELGKLHPGKQEKKEPKTGEADEKVHNCITIILASSYVFVYAVYHT